MTICLSPENVVVFPQPARCSDPKFKPLLTYKEWEMEQLFHDHTITQTMRKNANMVLRCNILALSLMMLTFAIRSPKNESFAILVYPKSSHSVPHFDGIIPITVGPKC